VNDPHGIFAQGIQSWHRIMSSGADVPARITLFEHAAIDIAGYCAKGFAKPDAVDELRKIADAFGLLEAKGEEEIQDIIARAFEHKKPNGKDHDAPGKPAITATLYIVPNPASIPIRQWLHARHYMRGNVTATVAPGGFGKTSLAIAETLELVKAGLRVWYISAEDDREELDRRIAAYVQHHGIDIGDRLFIDDKMTFPLKIARMGKNGPAFDEPALAAFEATIEANAIDVVTFDPFISFHYLPENDTAAMDALVKRLGEICARRRCCIELTHHVRKPSAGQGELTVHDARGAGAIVNAVRSCRVLNVMTAIEAEQAQIEPERRSFYLRIDSGKNNMAPPQKARWLHLVSVEIANGDHVGTVEPWEFPKVFAKLSVADIDWVQGLLRERAYRADSRSPEWLGLELARRFGRSVTSQGDVKWINAVLRTWEHEKVLFKEKRRDPDRKERTYFVLTPSPRPPTESATIVSLFPDHQPPDSAPSEKFPEETTEDDGE
jgi:hypothetical protein